jgi:hypothetical protein
VKQITVLEDVLRTEPLNWAKYNRHQDQEGLRGASPALKKAWEGFEPTWKSSWPGTPSARMPRNPPKLLPERLVRLARAMGSVNDGHRSSAKLCDLQRARWFWFKKAVLSVHTDIWWIFCQVASGVNYAVVAARFGYSDHFVESTCGILSRLWRKQHNSKRVWESASCGGGS